MMNSLVVLFLLPLMAKAEISTFQYYEQLIKENQKEAQTFKLPENNNEFRKGVEYSETLDYGISFDFVIVGAGSAGSVLATRLSERQDFSILLLEAGDEEDDFSVIPDGIFALQTNKKNWGYYSLPNNYSCLALPNQKCQIPRGKGIGGSSSINAQVYTRGSPEDYNQWEKLGNKGWSYKEILPYFIKSENSQIDGDELYHGNGGPLNVQYGLPHSKLLKTFLNACTEVNIPIIDYNGKSGTGAGSVAFTIKHGKRQSTGTAFLDMARQRKNLKVVTKALATKILLNGKKAEGVEFVTYDKKYKVLAKKEVILSGGAINSPQLLMLSGIGPKDHLQSLGIKVVADLPVGKTVKDHVGFFLPIASNYIEPIPSMETQIKQYLKGFGPFTKPGNFESLAFLKTDKNSNLPTIELLFGPPSISQVSNFTGSYGIQVLRQIHHDHVTGFLIILLDSTSNGEITLKSNDPLDYPLINENLLSNRKDRETLKKGIRFARKLLQTSAFRDINAYELPFPVCGNFDPQSEEFLDCVIPALTNSCFHISVTTPMGVNPKTSVVDNELKVHGIKNLRVVDAGVLPTLLASHTNAPTIMVAEKISDAIKWEHGAIFECKVSEMVPFY